MCKPTIIKSNINIYTIVFWININYILYKNILFTAENHLRTTHLVIQSYVQVKETFMFDDQ